MARSKGGTFTTYWPILPECSFSNFSGSLVFFFPSSIAESAQKEIKWMPDSFPNCTCYTPRTVRLT